MNPKVKQWLRDWIPPIVLRVLRGTTRSGIRFQGGYATWQQAVEASSGYDDSAILAKVKDATLKVKRGEAAYERDSVLFHRVDYSWPVLAGLMWVAARQGRLSVVDFGGSLGSSYFQNLALLSALRDVRWGVVEQPHYVACGKENLEDERLRFFSTIEACAAEIQPNVALLSAVLQYLREYEAIVHAVTTLNLTAIVVDRTVVHPSGRNRIYVQHVPPSIYAATYPCYSLSETALVRGFQRGGYELFSDFDSLPFSPIEAIGSKFKGYVFRRSEPR